MEQIVIELNKKYTKTQLDQLHKQEREKGLLKSWRLISTEDKRFCQVFDINHVCSEFWMTENDIYLCTKLGDESVEVKKEQYFTTGVMPTDRTQSKSYYTRRINGAKEKWNPITSIKGTGGSKTNERTG